MVEVDYGQVTGMVHSTESFGSVDGGDTFYHLLQGCKMRCQYCHNPDTWAMETNQSQRRTVNDVLKEALQYRHFWGKRVESLCQVVRLCCKWTLSLRSLLRPKS